MDLDLENSDGDGNNNDAVAVLRCPDWADPHKKERQPFTWLRAAPYVAATLTGAALLAGCMVLGDSCTAVAGSADQSRPINTNQCGWVVVLGFVRVLVLVIAALTALSALVDFECCCVSVPRLEDDR